MDVELARNLRCRRWLAGLPFRNSPPGYHRSFGRRNSLGHERALDCANRGKLGLPNDGNKEREHQSLAFASNNETSEELSVQLELLQEIAEVSTVLQKVQQGKLYQVTILYDCTLLLEGGNKCFELNKSCEFVNEQPSALQDYWKEEAMHRKPCHGAAKHDKPVEGNARGETRTMNSTLGKKSEIECKVSLVEETIPSHSKI